MLIAKANSPLGLELLYVQGVFNDTDVLATIGEEGFAGVSALSRGIYL